MKIEYLLTEQARRAGRLPHRRRRPEPPAPPADEDGTMFADPGDSAAAGAVSDHP